MSELRTWPKNFTLIELLESNTARYNFYNEQFNPPAEIKENLRYLANNVLQPLRDTLSELYGENPIKVNSGYRCRRLNEKVGGSPTSFHAHGMAADVYYSINGTRATGKLFRAILDAKIPFAELIWEYGDDKNPDWVHIAINPNVKPSYMIKRAIKGKGVKRITKKEALKLG